MEINQNSPTFVAAVHDFRRARQQAVLENIFAQLTGKSADLLSYEEISQLLKTENPINLGLQEIPLDAIVGSVGRYTDFSRTFLPRNESDKRHWAEVKAAMFHRGEIPPISLYKIDQAYFVLDGNHRVSVARQLGESHIKAYVTEIETDVPLTPDVRPDEIICKTRYAEFLRKTRLKELRPKADLSVTAPGQYHHLEEQINVHQRWLSRQEGRQVPYSEAVARWYDEIYWPVIKIIRRRGIMRRFPERTETDLFVWIFEHQAELRETLGWEIDTEVAVQDLVAQVEDKPQHLVDRVKQRLQEAITGPTTGRWRKEQLSILHPDRLFVDILVLVSGRDQSWTALKQATVIAWREESRLHGLHVVASADEKESLESRTLQVEFEQRCKNAAVDGELTLEAGKVVSATCRRARFTDLIVVHLSQLPRPQPGDRLRSTFSSLMRYCARPILAVPGQHAPLKRALLAYDGSPKANEALFVAAYLASKWSIPLGVVTVMEKSHVTSGTLNRAQDYLEQRGIEAAYLEKEGVIAEAIMQAAQEHNSDFMIMGGYGFSPVMEVIMGSEVDQILRARQWPVLICQ